MKDRPLTLPLLAGLILLSQCTAHEISHYPLTTGETRVYEITFGDPSDQNNTLMATTNLPSRSTGGVEATPQKNTLHIQSSAKTNGRTSISAEISILQTSHTFVAGDASGFSRIAFQPPNQSDPVISSPRDYFLKYPLEVGTSWTQENPTNVALASLPGTRLPESMNFEVAGIDETVTVRAGTFTGCAKISGTATVGAAPGHGPGESEITIEQHDWYCPGTGWVRQVMTETSGFTLGEGGKMSIEMISHNLSSPNPVGLWSLHSSSDPDLDDVDYLVLELRQDAGYSVAMASKDGEELNQDGIYYFEGDSIIFSSADEVWQFIDSELRHKSESGQVVMRRTAAASLEEWLSDRTGEGLPPETAVAQDASPAVTDATDEERYEVTLETLNHIGSASLSALQDNPDFGRGGKLLSAEELTKFLHPSDTFYYMNEVPTKDAWGFPIEVWIHGSRWPGIELLVRSPGSDGKFEKEPYETGVITFGAHDRDLVWADGRFRFPLPVGFWANETESMAMTFDRHGGYELASRGEDGAWAVKEGTYRLEDRVIVSSEAEPGQIEMVGNELHLGAGESQTVLRKVPTSFPLDAWIQERDTYSETTVRIARIERDLSGLTVRDGNPSWSSDGPGRVKKVEVLSQEWLGMSIELKAAVTIEDADREQVNDVTVSYVRHRGEWSIARGEPLIAAAGDPRSDELKAEDTASDLRHLAAAVGSLLSDQPDFGRGGVVLSGRALVAALNPRPDFSYMIKAPVRDAWGFPIEVWVNNPRAPGIVVLVRSPGRDGNFETDSYGEEMISAGFRIRSLLDRMEDFGRDIVWGDNRFLLPPL